MIATASVRGSRATTTDGRPPGLEAASDARRTLLADSQPTRSPPRRVCARVRDHGGVRLQGEMVRALSIAPRAPHKVAGGVFGFERWRPQGLQAEPPKGWAFESTDSDSVEIGDDRSLAGTTLASGTTVRWRPQSSVVRYGPPHSRR